ncbi:MAG TPA: terminase TerL endonuclease subunit [Gaiellaceae bacterium]|nr:terminase TerL endonuclease subunit [Gaiellaceae bacterium]
MQPGQARLVSLIDSDFERLRTVVIRKGRRSGMTACAALIAAWCGTVLAPRFRSRLLPGEEFAITLVATSREQAGVALGFIKRFLAASPILAEQVLAETTDSITLAGGCVIEAIPCSARSSRGRANGIVILDEAAHFVDSTGNQSLPAVLDALMPPLAQFGPLGLLLAISTPLDASGPFYEFEQQAASGQFDDMVALHLPTLEAMPHLAVEAERERARNPRRFEREWLGEYSSGEETFPLHAYDACVDPDYQPPAADPDRLAVFALDGAVSRDTMALVGVDLDWNLIYARAWHPPKGGTIDHREVLSQIVELTHRFNVVVIAYDPSQIHGLVLDALQVGLPMLSVSQAAGRAGGTMARHASALVEAMYERRLRLFASPELRQHVSRSRFSARTGGDRLVKLRSADKIDLAVALAMAVGVRQDLEREGLMHAGPTVDYEVVSIHDVVDFEPTQLNWYEPDPETSLGFGSSWNDDHIGSGYLD